MSGADFDSLKAILPDVSRETFERLVQFEQVFRHWNAKINLAAPSALDDLWSRHILDGAQIAGLRDLRGTWLDLGSGGGFPGIVLGVLMRNLDDANLHLVESIGKKAAFLRTALAETGGKGLVHHKRIEVMPDLVPQADTITARALAPLPGLLELAFPWLGDGATGLFHKGREYRQEIAAARDEWVFDLIEHQSKLDANSVILEISNVSRRLRN